PGRADRDGDCDDGDPGVCPRAPTIVCDGKDDDCDAAAAEAGQVTLDSGGQIYATIDAAVAAAAGGDTITLCEGSYAVNLAVCAPIALVGTYGANVATLGGGGIAATVTFHAGPDTVDGLAITNGLGGISLAAATTLTVTDASIA